MAAGDITISIEVEDGVTKSVVLDSATRVLARTHASSLPTSTVLDTDAKWQVWMVNELGDKILSQANTEGEREVKAAASWTPKTFTAAS